jgi:hypothetical protein
MNFRRCNKYGGKSANGNTKHIEARNAIIPIFDKVAANLEMPCELSLFFENREEVEPPLIVDPSKSALFEDVRTKELVREEICC